MVTEKDIKGLDFENMSQYMEYILDSVTNGQRQQARKLIEKMSTSQKKDLYNFLEEYGQNECVIETKKIVFDLI